jgi:methylated-DNA-[protein]-cysteine S-methyltransferase
MSENRQSLFPDRRIAGSAADKGALVTYSYKMMESPVGALKLITSDIGLAGILWENDKSWRVPHLRDAIEDSAHPLLLETERQLGEYFTGHRKTFDLPLDFVGEAFHQKVWSALLTIPYGETRTYGEIAKQIGEPDAARAVGAANAKNPISIVAPCHRVIGANGKLTGFAGGLPAKAHLLSLESDDLLKRSAVA